MNNRTDAPTRTTSTVDTIASVADNIVHGFGILRRFADLEAAGLTARILEGDADAIGTARAWLDAVDSIEKRIGVGFDTFKFYDAVGVTALSDALSVIDGVGDPRDLVANLVFTTEQTQRWTVHYLQRQIGWAEQEIDKATAGERGADVEAFIAELRSEIDRTRLEIAEFEAAV